MKLRFFNCWKDDDAGWFGLTFLRFTCRSIPERRYRSVSLTLFNFSVLVERARPL